MRSSLWQQGRVLLLAVLSGGLCGFLGAWMEEKTMLRPLLVLLLFSSLFVLSMLTKSGSLGLWELVGWGSGFLIFARLLKKIEKM